MKKKGFTLIELLAVIVILAIIALIATPLVLKYIEKSRKESKVDSAYSFVRNLETEIANYSIKHNGKKYNGQPSDKGYYELTSFESSEIDTAVKGDKPNSIKVCLSSLGQVEKAMFEYGKYYVSYNGKKGSISDSDTYDNFSCSNGETMVPKQEIEFVVDGSQARAMLDTCLDTSLFEYGKYYDVILTDDNGVDYKHSLIFQNSPNGMGNINDPFSLALSNTREALAYLYYPTLNQCAFINNKNSNGEFKYVGKYDFRIENTNKAVEPNYVFRFSVDSLGYLSSFEFFSSELETGDNVKIEISSQEYSETHTICGNCTEEQKTKYNGLYYKSVDHWFSGDGPTEPVDVKVIINDGEQVYNFKKEDFKFAEVDGGLTCVLGKYYYVGNNDIDDVDGC